MEVRRTNEEETAQSREKKRTQKRSESGLGQIKTLLFFDYMRARRFTRELPRDCRFQHSALQPT